MRHRRFDVATLRLDGDPVPVKAAYLLVAERLPDGAIDWECIAYGLRGDEVERGIHEVALRTLEGHELSGPAILVRSIEGTHVLRGDGPLTGFDPAELG